MSACNVKSMFVFKLDGCSMLPFSVCVVCFGGPRFRSMVGVCHACEMTSAASAVAAGRARE